MVQLDFNNTNGLEEGNIPARSACPFLDRCTKMPAKGYCPTAMNKITTPFYCGYAIGWSFFINNKRFD